MYVGLLLSTIKNKTRLYKYNFMIDNENLSVFLSLDYAVLEVLSLHAIQSYHILACWPSSNSKLLGVILGDVSVLPDGEVVPLGLGHGLVVLRQHLSKLPASLSLHQEETVSNQAFPDILVPNLGCHEGVAASPEIIIVAELKPTTLLLLTCIPRLS